MADTGEQMTGFLGLLTPEQRAFMLALGFDLEVGDMRRSMTVGDPFDEAKKDIQRGARMTDHRFSLRPRNQ